MFYKGVPVPAWLYNAGGLQPEFAAFRMGVDATLAEVTPSEPPTLPEYVYYYEPAAKLAWRYKPGQDFGECIAGYTDEDVWEAAGTPRSEQEARLVTFAELPEWAQK